MSPIPSIPSGGKDDFSQRLAAEQAKISGQAPSQEQARATAQQAQQAAAGQQPAQAAAQSQAQQGKQDDDESTGPVGQGDYVVKRGDCISKIAKETGHFWETIWNDAANAELKNTRKDPNVLLPEDRVTIPDLRDKEEDCATEQLHEFRRLGEPAKLRMRLMQEPEPAAEEFEDDDDTQDPDQQRPAEQQEDEPRADVPYVLEIDGVQYQGRTDDDGRLEHPIPGNAKRGKLTIEPGTAEETVIPLQLGHLDPITETRGVKQRLYNLGFDCGDQDDDAQSADYEAALKVFQEKHGLEKTGRADQDTRDKLQEQHDS